MGNYYTADQVLSNQAMVAPGDFVVFEENGRSRDVLIREVNRRGDIASFYGDWGFPVIVARIK